MCVISERLGDGVCRFCPKVVRLVCPDVPFTPDVNAVLGHQQTSAFLAQANELSKRVPRDDGRFVDRPTEAAAMDKVDGWLE